MSSRTILEISELWKKYLIFGLVFLLLTACAPSGSIPITGDEPTAEPVGDLANTKWELVSFGWPGAESQAAATPVIEGSTITLEFDAEGGAGGSGGCNHYSAQYEVQENMLSFGEITRTLIACEEGIDQQEQRFFRALETARAFELAEDHLVIWYDDGQGVLYFVKWVDIGTPSITSTPQATIEPTGTPTRAAMPTPVPPQSRERVNFEPGAVSATRSGALPAGGVKEYVLWAVAGQTVHVQTVAPDAPVEFTLRSPAGETWSGEPQPSDVYIFTVQVILPRTGDYVVRLSVPPDMGGTHYDVIFTIPADPQPSTPPPVGSPQPITFETGQISATVSGNLQASGSDSYVLRAVEGQTMMVELSFAEGQAILAIWGADGNVLMSDHAEASNFSGILPATQDYYILVKGRPDGETDYSMEIVIPRLK